jgi:hypothetical protein
VRARAAGRPAGPRARGCQGPPPRRRAQGRVGGCVRGGGRGPWGATGGARGARWGATRGLPWARAERPRGGRRRGGGGEEREGEGRGAHLGVQLRRSPSPKSRVPRGERGRLLRGRIEMRERDRGARAWGAGGARGARAELCRARLGWVGSGQAGLSHTAGQNPVARTTTNRKTIREAKSETELSNTRN